MLLTEAPTTDVVAISVTPIMRAPAVDAVRRGLRAAFSRASRPGIPNRAWMGRPSTRTTGRAIAGLATLRPTKVTSAPMPVSASTAAVLPTPAMPSARHTTPAAVTAPPTATRRRHPLRSMR